MRPSEHPPEHQAERQPSHSDANEPILIQPAAAPLSHGRAQRGSAKERLRRRLSVLRVATFCAVLAVLGGVAAFVFVALPERVETPRHSPSPGASPAATVNRAQADETIPPYRALELAQARARAEDGLKDFVDLQLTLQQELNIAAWGEADLAAVKDRANAADALFLETKYEAAIAEYAGAVADLHALLEKGNGLFEAAVAAGNAALAERDAAAAGSAFERALAIRPNDARAAAGAARAAKLPEVLALLRESERAALRGDHDRAYRLLAQARSLDSATPDIDARLAALAATRADERRKATLSDGFAALADGTPEAALEAFATVLRDHPDDPAALAGRQQAEQARTLATIDGLRASALASLQGEDWHGALASYDDALAIDPSLQFARDGKRLVQARVDLIAAMQRVTADPGLLSAEREFQAARETLRLAGLETDAGEQFAARLATFKEVVERSATPVSLVLLSDNATEVMIHKVGAIGTFERHELALRPGRYVIVGSRDGCRDVRKEIVLTADTPPVDVRCVEHI